MGRGPSSVIRTIPQIQKPLRSEGLLRLHLFLCRHFFRHLLERTKRACGNANTLAIYFDGLEVHVLSVLGGTVGVATGLREVRDFSSEDADAGHIRGI